MVWKLDLDFAWQGCYFRTFKHGDDSSRGLGISFEQVTKKRTNSCCFWRTCPRETIFWTRQVLVHSHATISHHETVPVWLSPAHSHHHQAWCLCWGANALQLMEMLNTVSFALGKMTSGTSSLQTLLFSAIRVRSSRLVQCECSDFVRKRPHGD